MSNRLIAWLRGRTSTTESTAVLWAKSLLNAVLFFTVFMAALPWAAHKLLPYPAPISPALGDWGGAALFAVGIGIWLVCLDAFSRRGRGTPLPSEAPRNLVTDGPFGVARNPIIAAELMVIWGEALYVASWGLLVYAIVTTVAGDLIVRYIEEPELRKRFGESYETYCRDVPRWLPRFRSSTMR